MRIKVEHTGTYTVKVPAADQFAIDAASDCGGLLYGTSPEWYLFQFFRRGDAIAFQEEVAG